MTGTGINRQSEKYEKGRTGRGSSQSAAWSLSQCSEEESSNENNRHVEEETDVAEDENDTLVFEELGRLHLLRVIHVRFDFFSGKIAKDDARIVDANCRDDETEGTNHWPTNLKMD